MPFPSVSPLKAIKLALATIFVTVVSFSGNVNGISADTVIDSPLLTQKIGTNTTILVDQEGDGEFTTIQEAINSVPVNNNKWIIIHVRKGVYRYELFFFI